MTPTQWQCTNIYSDTNTVTVYKYLQWHQHSDSVQVSTVSPTQWQCKSIYSDYQHSDRVQVSTVLTNTDTVYKYLQWHQHSDSTQVFTVTPIQRKCKSIYSITKWQCTSFLKSDTNTMMCLFVWDFSSYSRSRRYMTKILPVRRKTLSNQSINPTREYLRIWGQQHEPPLHG